jgi:hypothetical protein
MMFKRTEFDSSRGSVPVGNDALASTMGTDLPPLRTISQNTRQSGGQSPGMVKRNEGAPTGAEKKTDKRDLKSVGEKMADERLNQMGKRKGLDS